MALLATDDGFGMVRNTDPHTSEEAAKRSSYKKMMQYEIILEFVKARGPVNNEDIANYMEASQISDISPRVSELIHQGRLKADGTKRSSRGSKMRAVVVA